MRSALVVNAVPVQQWMKDAPKGDLWSVSFEIWLRFLESSKDVLCPRVLDRDDKQTDLENDPSLLQLIPYTAIVRQGGSEHGSGSVFTMRRLDGDERLKGKISIGAGGHMEVPLDGNISRVIYQEAMREINEEINVMTSLDLQFAGLYYNPESLKPVDHVHLGMFFIARVAQTSGVEVRETNVLEGSWRSIDGLREQIPENTEEWTKVLLINLPHLLERFRC
jgi:predicted NUDIX family phosphoesterase